MSPSNPLSEAEWKVMQVVWERHPTSARDVLEQLEGETGWAYTTVKTILSRLADKGILDATREGKTSHYAPRVSRHEARRVALRSLLDRAFNGAFGSLLHHLVDDETLSDREREQLREIVESERDATPEDER